MTIQTMSLNDVAIEDLGFTLQSIDGFSNAPQRTYQKNQGPLIIGARKVSAGTNAGARTFNFALLTRPASFAARQATVDALIAMFAGTVEIAKADAPFRVCYGELDQLTLAQPSNVASHPFVRPESVITMPIISDEPLWYDRYPVITNIPAGATLANGNPVALAMGTAPIRRLKIVLFGAATNPTITLRDQTGAAVETMVFTGSLGSSDYLTIDCGFALTGGRSVIKSDGTDLLQAGWLAMPQTFFNPRPPMLPTLESTAGAMLVYHHRSYWS